MMGKKKSKDDKINSTLKFTEVVSACSSIIRHGITWGGIVGCVYLIMNGLKYFAGTSSNANFLFSFFGDLKLNEWAGFLFGFGGVAYGGVQRQIKKKVIREKSGRIDFLERILDERKQTSGLKSTGDTNHDY